VVWIAVVVTTIYLFIFQREAVQRELRDVMSTSLFAAGFIYVLLGGLRGFTLLPATPLLVLGVAFFPPIPLYILTLAGILLASAVIYWFSESLRLDEIFNEKHASAMAHLKALLHERELPVIIIWCLFPVTPTDLIVYVCGMLRVDFKKCLLGVAIGAGINCAVVIFLGDYLLRLFGLKV